MFGSGFVSGQACGVSGAYWQTLFSHALASEIDAIGIVNEAVQDGIGERWICYDFPPVIQGHLTGDDR